MLVLFVTEIQGLYFLSSVLLIRDKLPDRYRGFITEALGDDLEFLFYQNFYDLIFLTSAVLSIILLYAHHTTSSRAVSFVHFTFTLAILTLRSLHTLFALELGVLSFQLMAFFIKLS